MGKEHAGIGAGCQAAGLVGDKHGDRLVRRVAIRRGDSRKGEGLDRLGTRQHQLPGPEPAVGQRAFGPGDPGKTGRRPPRDEGDGGGEKAGRAVRERVAARNQLAAISTGRFHA